MKPGLLNISHVTQYSFCSSVQYAPMHPSPSLPSHSWRLGPFLIPFVSGTLVRIETTPYVRHVYSGFSRTGNAFVSGPTDAVASVEDSGIAAALAAAFLAFFLSLSSCFFFLASASAA